MKPLHLAAVLLPFLVTACSDRSQQAPAIAAAMAAHREAAAAPANVPQCLELIIDGKPLKMEVDNPRDGHVSVNHLVRNALTISAMDRDKNVFLSVTVTPADGSPLKPGTYLSFKCLSDEDCTDAERAHDDKHTETMLMPYPGNEASPRDPVHAFKSPSLKLEPTTVTITSMEDAYWHGVGPAKRVKGTFSGTLAAIEADKEGRKVIAGPLKKIEGKFDLYTGRSL